MVPTPTEVMAFVVELENDETRRNGLGSGWSLFEACRDAGLVGGQEIDAFAVVVQTLVEEELLRVGSRTEGVQPPPREARWSGYWLQQQFEFASTVAGRADASLCRQRERSTTAANTPARELRIDPDVLGVWFERLHLIFQLPKGADFPALGTSVGVDDAQRLKRYVRSAQELAESSVLNTSGYGYRVAFTPAGITSVDADLPASETVRGVAVLFRQLYANEERASFAVTSGLLRKWVEETTDALTERRREMLNVWRSAEAKLRKRWLEGLALDICKQEGLAPSALPEIDGHITPEGVLSAYFYGEHIHWGRRADQVQAWSDDLLDDARHRLLFLSAMAQLSALYVGFGALLVTAAPFDSLLPAAT